MIDQIINIVFEYGWFFAIFLGLILLLGKIVHSNYDKWFNKESQEENGETNLKNHTFFSNAQYRLAIDIPNLTLIPGKPIREKAFKELLKICFNNFFEGAKNFINDDMSDWDAEAWVNFMTQNINKIVINMEERARLEGIPEPMIRKFLDWHLESIESLQEHILLLGNSKIYVTNITKTSTLLLIMNLLLVVILGDAERVLAELNGEITGLNYKGMIIE